MREKVKGNAAKVVNIIFAVLLVVGLAPLASPAKAYAATLGCTGIGRMEVSYGTGDWPDGTWSEGFLTADGVDVWCIDPYSNFQTGAWAEPKDAVSSGRISQACMTDIALAYQFINDGKFHVSNQFNDGHYVTDWDEKYCIIQCYVWWIMRDYGYNDYGWFGATLDGVGLTGGDDGYYDLWNYIYENRDDWVGHGTVYDAAVGQDVMGYIGLTPATGDIEITKGSANEAITDGNDCYSLEGAVYGVYADESCSGDPVATLTTDEDGWARAENIKRGNYWVKEITAPPGYALDETAHAVSVPAGDTAYYEYDDVPQNDPAAMWVGKIDLETTLNMPQGSASLAGAEYTVRYYDGFYDTAEEAEASGDPTRTWVVATNENGYADLSEAFLVSGDELYTSSAGISTIPLGTLLIQKTKAPDGYILDGNTVYVRQITSVGTAESVTTFNPPEHPEQVKRGDLSLVKTREDSQTRLAGVPFRITSQTTGEWHVVVTDANGELNTASGFNPHTQRTNANDAAVTANGDGAYSVDESRLDPEAGVWFSGTADAATDPDDAKGALPYDTYAVEELPVEANEGLSLVSLTATVTRDGYEIDLGTVDDQPMTVSTAARDAVDGDKVVSAEEGAVVIDRVDYAGANPGSSYRLDATLVDAATGEPAQAGGAPVTGSAEFTAAAAAGYAEVEISFDGLALEEGPYVVYEAVTELSSGRVVAVHEDLADAAQTIELKRPEIGTTATDAASGGHEAVIDPELTIVDTVAYKGLSTAREYTLEGTLMDKATGEPVLDAQGEPVTAETTFTPQAASGTAEVTFTFDATALEEGTELVAFETLSSGGREYAVHADIDDEGQTVKLTRPDVATVASDAASGTHEVSADTEAGVIDAVAVSGMAPGKDYVLKGSLMVVGEAEDGSLSAEPLTDADGDPVTSELAFTAQLPDEQHEMAFGPFDASSLGGKTLVVYEKLCRGGAVIASHEDPSDQGQTLEVVQPEIGTVAADGLDGDKTVVADPEASIVDTVNHIGLVPGKDYVLKGSLMVVGEAEDGSLSAEPLTDADGNPVESQTAFTPQLANGEQEVTFEFDASLLGGKSLVVYETLYRGDTVIASHADPADKGQTVQVASPEIMTDASDALDGDKTVVADPEAEVTDQVAYANLVPGAAYTAYGVLMDASTGLPLLSGEGAEDVSDAALEAFWEDFTALFGADVPAVPAEGAQAEAEGEPAAEAAAGGALGDAAELAAQLEDAERAAEAAERALPDPSGASEGEAGEAAGRAATLVPGPVDLGAVAALLDSNEAVTSHLSVSAERFVPEHAEGSIEVSFGLDASELAGRDTVVFEFLVKGDDNARSVAMHADIDDPGQTVEIVGSEIGTEATDAADGDHVILNSASAKVVDTVTYANLVPGKSYTLKAELMDKSTGKVLLSGDEPVTAEVEFVPNQPSGTAEVVFEFDASGLAAGTQLVAFEHLWKDGLEVAAHADIDDEAQTVTVEEPPLGGAFGKTGASILPWIAGAAVAACAGGAAAAWAVRRRKAASGSGAEDQAA